MPFWDTNFQKNKNNLAPLSHFAPPPPLLKNPGYATVQMHR